MRAFWILATLVLHAGIHSDELWLLNNSPFPLRAQVVYGVAGILEEQTVPPQAQWHWSNDQAFSGPANDPNTGTSSYSVFWYCTNGGEYGVNTNVIPGSWVFAQEANGSKSCPLPKKAQKSTTPTTQ
ncbi:MAG: hypothetical protein KF898_01440 [Parachlamydiales bacterium]|nr:hypothetical protein [Candidatus Acheromyda pituitae]